MGPIAHTKGWRIAPRGYNNPLVSNPVCDAYHKCGGHPQ
jgi:hypothetical protein